MVGESESFRVQKETRQRDHMQLYEILAVFFTVYEERRRAGRSMVSEPLALLSPQPVNQVSATQQRF